VTSTLRRAGAYAAVGTLALAGPALGAAAAAPFAALAVLAVFVVDDGPLFELFARPGDYEDGQLNGLAGFALAATGLAILTFVPGTAALPVEAFVTAVLVVAYGNLGSALVATRTTGPFPTATGFVVLGALAGTTGLAVVALTAGPALGLGLATGTFLDAAGSGPATPVELHLPRFAVLAVSGAVTAALLRTVLYERDDPWILLSVGLVVGLLAALIGTPAAWLVGTAFVVTLGLGYASYALGTASVAGMLTGVLLAILIIVLGGVGWFGLLVTFFVVGSLSTKFRYDAKQQRGVAEPNEGARGTANVLGNAAVALGAVLGYAAAPELGVAALRPGFLFAFAGSLAAAMSDTLSSEVGGLFDGPRLITTLEPVPPGTDGGVTWQGELAGLVGAGVLAGLSLVLLPVGNPVVGAAVVAAGGVAGMTVDSVLGATVEGGSVSVPGAPVALDVDNEVVNFAATFAGGVVSGALALGLAV